MLLDFGHNPVAIRSVIALARSLVSPGRDLRITIGMPGDRLDRELHAIAGELAAGAPAEVVVRELSADLLRGRAPGEIPAVLVAGLRAHGVTSIGSATSELEALDCLLATAVPGDVVLVLVHLEPAVLDRLAPPESS